MRNVKIILLVGRMGSGKDLIAGYIKGTADSFNIAHADEVKILCADMYQVKLSIFHSHNKNDICDAHNITYREMMQRVGDGMRQLVDKDVWCRKASHSIKTAIDDQVECIVVSDIRYESEIEYYKRTFDDVTTICIDRPSRKIMLGDDHISEMPPSADYTILNDGSLDDLFTATRKLLIKINAI